VLKCSATIDPEFRVGTIDRRLFGSFVEHLGRCVYGGIYEPGSTYADADGYRTDVLELIRELGTTIVRYPGGNFVSGYRWEDGVGPVSARPTRLDLAWRTIESNQFGLHEFIKWAALAGVQPMMAVNLGTRGIQESCDLLEYANHPGGSALSDLRSKHGGRDPFAIKLWCLGNEMDGPWQVGHKDADAYGALAAETAKAMRQIDPTIELVVCGSSNERMPTFGSWEATVLDHAFEHVDYVSLHSYYEPRRGDLSSFLASGYAMDQFIRGVAATADHVAAKKKSRKRLRLSFDEWNVWYEERFVGHTQLELAKAPRLLEDEFSGLDAVVVGSLLMTLLRHADRIGVACLAQLVNVIAPIRAEPDTPAWRQTIFHPLALTARYARGSALDTRSKSPLLATVEHGDVPAVDVIGTIEDESGELTVLAVNRHLTEATELSVTVRALPDVRVVEHLALGGTHQLTLPNTAVRPDAVTARPDGDARIVDGTLCAHLQPASWNLVRLTTTAG
jgi:alpha-N-arabinofuranosidase